MDMNERHRTLFQMSDGLCSANRPSAPLCLGSASRQSSGRYKQMKGLTILTICCFIVISCIKNQESKNMHNQEIIKEALSSLLTRNNDDAFVIIEDEAKNKFVQFAGNSTQDLLLDLPSQTLNEHELERAKLLFKKYDVYFEKWDVYDEPGGKVSGQQYGFSMNLGDDVDKAAHITISIFTEVYKFPPEFKMNIEEN
jgi:hypothetical protein